MAPMQEPFCSRTIRPGKSGSSTNNFFLFNGSSQGSIILFSASDGTNGSELWRTDGTPGGTSLVANINPSGSSSTPQQFVAVGNKVLFSAQTSTNGRELWITDGTAAGTRQVKDIYPGSSGGFVLSASNSPVAIDSVAFFRGTTEATGSELWMSDGTEAGTKLVSEFKPAGKSGAPANFTVLNGTLYFTAANETNGDELWKLTVDKCLADPFKLESGTCGCGTPDTDSDGDGTPDCLDQCSANAAKTTPGVCGCSVSDSDANGNGQSDCLDPTSTTVPQAPKVKLAKEKVSIVMTFYPGATYRILVEQIARSGRKQVVRKQTIRSAKNTFSGRLKFKGNVKISYQTILGGITSSKSVTKNFRVP